MSENRVSRRAKANFPTALLTLLSIVQALALELLWGHLTEQSYLYELSFLAVLGWTQISATLLGILLIWLIYSDLVLRLSWVPTTTDAVFPFLVGILEFAQINLLGPSSIGPWFLVLSVLFAAMTWISHRSMKRARLDDDNHEFFDRINPANWRDHLRAGAPAGILAVLGVSIWLSGSRGWFVLVAIVFVAILLSYQIWMNHVYTSRSYQSE
ncbi:MAG: hypothetical protein AAF541_08635 [Pseudomonadota bacterium]